jgi:hypothetical protein
MAKLCKIVLNEKSLLLLFFLLFAWAPVVLAQWVDDGVAICLAAGGQNQVQITSDGSGGAIIAWVDWRNGNNNYDVFAQKINAIGIPYWTQNGVPICILEGNQAYPQIVSDGNGGAIISWQGPWGGPNGGIFAQRILADGHTYWTPSGNCITSSPYIGPYSQLISDGTGGAIITWVDEQNDNVYAQRVNADGAMLWGGSGVPVCVGASGSKSPNITPDGAGGAIITWRDNRTGKYDVYAQRVDRNGNALWATNGAAVCTATVDQPGSIQQSIIAADADGGAVIAWEDYRSGDLNLYAQKVDSNGTKKWPVSGLPVCAALGDSDHEQIMSCDSGGAIITWRGNQHIYAQRIDGNGNILWDLNGKLVSLLPGSDSRPHLTTNGKGGCITVWQNYYGNNLNVYAQNINAAGGYSWTSSGVPICTASGWHQFPQIASDGCGGSIMAWQDYRNETAGDIYAQRVDAAGHTVVATLLQNYSATFSESGISLTWILSEIDKDVEFFIERSSSRSGPYIELPSSTLTRDGLSFSFTDRDWEPNATYWYRVEYFTGIERKTLFESGPITTPAIMLTLHQNSPNPFNPSTEIRYYLPEKCSVSLDVYDVTGVLVARLSEGQQSQGSHTVSWDGRDGNGRQASSGVYFYRLKAGKTEISKKMVLAR